MDNKLVSILQKLMISIPWDSLKPTKAVVVVGCFFLSRVTLFRLLDRLFVVRLPKEDQDNPQKVAQFIAFYYHIGTLLAIMSKR